MLDMAKVGKNDIVYDLGCGDGRIVAMAAKKFGASGVGVDIDPERIKESHETLKKYSVEKLVEIRQGDALKVKDLEQGDGRDALHAPAVHGQAGANRAEDPEAGHASRGP